MRKNTLPNDPLTVRILFLNVMIFLFIGNINAQTTLTVKGVEFTIMPNSIVSTGNLFITKGIQTVDGKTQVKDGEILNSGDLFVSDSIINQTDSLFIKTSNPYLAKLEGKKDVESAGTVIFNGFKSQIINSDKSGSILFNHMNINNSKGVILMDTICALGKVSPLTGNVFLNGKNLELFYDKSPFTKYDGRLGTESNDFKIWDTTKVGNYKILDDRRSGHIVTKYKNNDALDSSNLGISSLDNYSIQNITSIERGHLSLPYAGNGSIKKYFVINTGKGNITKTYIISYLDSSDFENLHIKEPDFRVFLNDGKSAVTFSQTPVSTSNSSSAIAENVVLNSGSSYVLTVADSACDNPPRTILKINGKSHKAEICQRETFNVKTDSTLQTNWQAYHLIWYKNGLPFYPNEISKGYFQDTLNSLSSAIYKVKIYDNRGCFSYSSDTVTSHPIPVAGFKKDDHGAGYCAGIEATFTDTSNLNSPDRLTRHWYWGDGMKSTIDTTTIAPHTFINPGTFQVTMISTSKFGCIDTFIKPVEIHAYPKVNFTKQQYCSDSSLLVKFVNNTDSSAKALWKFDVNDSIIQLASNINLKTPFFHHFNSTGLKNVSLSITNSGGCTSSLTDSVRVFKQTANFTTSGSVCLGSKINFQNLSTIDASYPIYNWDFGDSTFSTLASPEKKYNNDDTYNVTLHMHSGVCNDSITKTINILPHPSASFVATNACAGSTLQFIPTDKSLKTYQWNINGKISQDVSPEEIFATGGIFPVSLSVSSALGCEATSNGTFEVFNQPKAAFTYQNGCLGDSINFFNQSSIIGGSLTYQWSFDGDDPSIIKNPGYLFIGNAGSKSVKLIAISNHNCTDTIEKTVDIYPLPNPGMASPISYCTGSYILDATVPESVATSSFYTWNNGTRQPTLTVTKNGKYTVDIVSDKGCKFSESVLVTLNAKIDSHLPGDTSFCGKGMLDTHYADSTSTWYKNGSFIASQRKLLVNEDGWYKAVVADKSCSGFDSVYVTIRDVPKISLGNDISTCEGTKVTLNAGDGLSSYKWSTGETSSTITIASPARYKVTVTNASGCSNADTINIQYLPIPVKPLDASITKCFIATLDAGSKASSYLWSTGETTSNIQVSATGNYWVKISNTNPCFVYDTISVNIQKADPVNLGNDISVCQGKEVILDAGNHNANYTYKWNKQSSQSSKYTVLKAGRYIAEILNTANGCSSSDTIFVQMNPSPHVNLGNDKALCNALMVSLDAGNAGSLTQWGSSTGVVSTQQTFSVKDPGKYWVTVMNEFGCLGTDTIQVYPSSASLMADFLAASRVYTGDTVNFKDMSYPDPYTCKWMFGDGVQSSEANPYHIFYMADTFRVTLTVDNNFCSSTITKPIAVSLGLKRSALGDKIGNENFIEILSSKLYPNPTTGEFTFEMQLSDFANVQIVIYNLQGKLIAVDKPGKIDTLTKNYNLGNLPSGIYIFKASVGKNAATYKIVKY